MPLIATSTWSNATGLGRAYDELVVRYGAVVSIALINEWVTALEQVHGLGPDSASERLLRAYGGGVVSRETGVGQVDLRVVAMSLMKASMLSGVVSKAVIQRTTPSAWFQTWKV